MDANKNYRKSAYLYILPASCFLVAGWIGILRDGTMPYMLIGLACAFFCFGFVRLAKARGKDRNGNET